MIPVTPRDRWKKYLGDTRTKCLSLSYDEVLDYFSPPALTERQIASMLNISPAQVHRLKHGIFAEDIPAAPKVRTEAWYRRSYERSTVRSRNRVPYDELLAMFREPHFRLQDVARHLGVNVKSASNVYRSFFESVLGMNGHTRAAQRRRLRATERHGQYHGVPHLLVVSHAAEEAGLHVRRFTDAKRFQVSWKKRALLIDGHRCFVNHVTNLSNDSRRKGTQRFVVVRVLRSSVLDWDAHIVFVDIPTERRRILVIPGYVIARNAGGRRFADIRLRISGHGKKQFRQKVDWFKYENAWHLLEGE